MVGLIGKKLGQTRVYDPHGNVVCVTVVQCGPDHVIQNKTVERDGYAAVQLGFDEQKPRRLTRPIRGHFDRYGSAPCKRIREFRDFSIETSQGAVLRLKEIFRPGDFVDAVGTTKGRGFQGVMKRHHFRGGTSTHGSKGWKRRPGAIGQRSSPGTVRRGQKMPGHMGGVRRTVQNLEVIDVKEAQDLLLVKGAIPGARGDYVIIREAKKRPRKVGN